MRLKKPATAVLFLAAIALFVLLLTPKILRIRELRTRSEKLDLEISQLKKKNRLLEAELKLLHYDPVYVEKVAREKLNKAKEGEIVYRVVREKRPVS